MAVAKKAGRPSLSTGKQESGGLYFESADSLETFSSGCKLLDCVLGNGWPVGRIVNIIGDKSTNKTGLSMEAATNFLRTFEDGIVRYVEAEAAFNKDYASMLGAPVDRMEFPNEEGSTGKKAIFLIEEFGADLITFCEKRKKDGKHGLYIIDSLDALSDVGEMKKEFGDASYGNKAKKMSELFRRITGKIEQSSVTLIVVSQVRDNIGVMFGSKHTRSGGRALDFYSSINLWLSQVKEMSRTSKKVKRTFGIRVKAKAKKNKVGLPQRECEFSVIFSYGIDDVGSHLQWLSDIGQLDEIDIEAATAKEIIAKGAGRVMDIKDERRLRKKLNVVVKRHWRRIEHDFLPARGKY